MKEQLHKYLGVAAALVAVAMFVLFIGFGEPLENSLVSTNMQDDQVAAVGEAVDGDEKLRIEEVEVGTGAAAEAGDVVSVHYTGALLADGTVFDSSRNREPIQFTLGSGQVIEGWEKGLVGMQEGGKRILLIDPAYAYGETGVPGVIPANAALIFEVELVSVQKPAS